MQRKQNDDQRLGICHRLFNFILNTLIGGGLKRVTYTQPQPQPQPQPQGGLTNQVAVDEHTTRNGVHEPLLSRAKPNGATAERVNLNVKDDSDAAVQIHFKQTEELDDWTPVDEPATKDDNKAKEMKEIPLLNGTSVGTTSTTKPKVQVEGSTGLPKVIIPIKDSAAGQEEKKKKAGNKFPRPDSATAIKPDASSKPVLTGLGLNINEISETFIQNTRERMSRNVSWMEREDS